MEVRLLVAVCSLVGCSVAAHTGEMVPAKSQPIRARSPESLPAILTDQAGSGNWSPGVAYAPVDLAARAVPAVVVVRTETTLGSGFAVFPGQVVTNLHVVQGQSTIKIITHRGTERTVTAVRAWDTERDLVVLVTEPWPCTPLPLGDSDRVPQGARILVVGSPHGLHSTVSEGLVSAVRPMGDGTRLFQITAPLSSGSSGGPVLDTEGRVIGVASFMMRGGQALGFAFPSAAIRRLLAQSLHQSVSPSEFAELTRTPARTEPDAAPPAPSRSSFPRAVAGFAFGMTLTQVQELCPDLVVADTTRGLCPYPLVSPPFGARGVVLGFSGGWVSEVWVLVESLAGAGSALVERYGPPDAVQVRREGRWVSGGEWEAGKAGRAIWSLGGGDVILASLDGKDAWLAYLSSQAKAGSESSY